MERRHHQEPALFGNLHRHVPRLVEIPAALDQLRAEGAHGSVLLGGIAFRHDDCRRDAGAARRIGNALTVIAARCADEAFGPLARFQKGVDIDKPAADLERACGRMVFMLDHGEGAGALGKQRPRILRRRRHDA